MPFCAIHGNNNNKFQPSDPIGYDEQRSSILFKNSMYESLTKISRFVNGNKWSKS